MMIRAVVLLMLGLACVVSPGSRRAWAQQDNDVRRVEDARAQESAYMALCRRHNLRCTLVYGEKAGESRPAPEARLREPGANVNGPLALVLVLVGIAATIGLWMRFGNGGVLLSAAPRDMKQERDDVPEDWRAAGPQAEERPDQFLQKIAAMEDRRQALVQLLRRCLVHAADVTGTRLFRSDTERVVFRRLPISMPGREQLETLLTQTELVHYGGRPLAENQFATLLAAARQLLVNGRSVHA